MSVPIFHIEVNARSNFYPEDNCQIEEHGHWLPSQKIVQRTVERINRIIKI